MLRTIVLVFLLAFFPQSYAGSVQPPDTQGQPPPDMNFFHQEWCWNVSLDARYILTQVVKKKVHPGTLYSKARHTPTMSPGHKQYVYRLITDFQNSMRAGIKPEDWYKKVVQDCFDSMPQSTFRKVQSEGLYNEAAAYWGFELGIDGCKTNMAPAAHRCVLAWPEFRYEGNQYSEADTKGMVEALNEWTKRRSFTCNLAGVVAYHDCLGPPPSGVTYPHWTGRRGL